MLREKKQKKNYKNKRDNHIAESFFMLLWKKDNQIEAELNIKIPHTIIIKYGKISAWYFSNSESKVLKKNSDNSKNEDLLNFFKKRPTSRNHQHIKAVKYILDFEVKIIFINVRQDKVSLEYLNIEDLEMVLMNPNPLDKNIKKFYILQEYIESDAEYNS